MAYSSEQLHAILHRYWGYDTFRYPQQDIIMSVLEGHDTLGLMPTGGGKSLTFQVPAMLLDGLTVVITPLISLMKDQVDNLREHDIPATYLFSGLTSHEQRLAIEKCRYGKTKILYLSPEKLCSGSFLEVMQHLDVSLIVVDEAHCISQWGYDFRPSYLKIKKLRAVHPNVPVLALTASATPSVADDICYRLGFKEDSRRFTLSFARPNISFIVRPTESKDAELVHILSSTLGSAIVYVRSRRRTREIAALLKENGIDAEFYHAGLDSQDKNERQNRWKSDEVRVMVATNAFGMGIDKPDVRLVIHYDLPSTLEEYYQEAGRAGRDGKESFAVVLSSKYDKSVLSRRLAETYPPKETLRHVYEMAGNFLDVPVGEGFNHVYEFDLPLFSNRFSINKKVAHNSLQLLTAAGYIDYQEDVSTASRLMVIMTRDELYDLELPPVTERIFQLVLRSYPGLFADYVIISEASIAGRLALKQETVYENMLLLARKHVINYIPHRTTPYIYYTTSREEPQHLVFPRAVYEDRKADMTRRVEAMKSFVFGNDRCRVQSMLGYFGETDCEPCGKCDYCRMVARYKREHEVADEQRRSEDAKIRKTVLEFFKSNGSADINTLARYCSRGDEASRNRFVEVVRLMADEGLINLQGIKVSSKVSR